MIFLLVNGVYEDPRDFKDNTIFIICMAMKTLRLAHANEVADSLKRLMDFLGEIFYL